MCKAVCAVISKELGDILHIPKNRVELHIEGLSSPITGTLLRYDKKTGKVVVLSISPSDGWPSHPEKSKTSTVCATKVVAVSVPGSGSN